MNLEINLTKAVQFIEKFYETLLKDIKDVLPSIKSYY